MTYPYCANFGALTEVDMRISFDFSPIIDSYQLQNFSGTVLTSTT